MPQNILGQYSVLMPSHKARVILNCKTNSKSNPNLSFHTCSDHKNIPNMKKKT